MTSFMSYSSSMQCFAFGPISTVVTHIQLLASPSSSSCTATHLHIVITLHSASLMNQSATCSSHHRLWRRVTGAPRPPFWWSCLTHRTRSCRRWWCINLHRISHLMSPNLVISFKQWSNNCNGSGHTATRPHKWCKRQDWSGRVCIN